MFIYIRWKYDLGEEKKIKIFYIGTEKETEKTKYQVSISKYCLTNIEFIGNHDHNDHNDMRIYNSRIRVGKLKSPVLHFTSIQKINPNNNNSLVIKVYIHANLNSSSVILKSEIYDGLGNIINNPNNLNYHDYNVYKNKIIVKMIKDIKTMGQLCLTDSNNLPVEFRFVTETYYDNQNFLPNYVANRIGNNNLDVDSEDSD
jgi:hypothetical protein